MAEIHPNLLKQLSDEADNMTIWRTETSYVEPKDILSYFAKRVLDFRREKVRAYLSNPENFGKDLHPAIGNLLNLQFTYGHDKEKEGLSDADFTQLCVAEFIKHENIEGVEASYFVAQQEQQQDTDEDEDEYTDGEEELDDDIEYAESDFSLIDESSRFYGSSIQDLINIFNYFVSQSKKICGINTNRMGYKQKEAMIDFLYKHVCEPDDPGAMEIVFLQEANILNHTGVYVNNISGSDIETRIKEMHIQ
jgi:hypothetical protein